MAPAMSQDEHPQEIEKPIFEAKAWLPKGFSDQHPRVYIYTLSCAPANARRYTLVHGRLAYLLTRYECANKASLPRILTPQLENSLVRQVGFFLFNITIKYCRAPWDIALEERGHPHVLHQPHAVRMLAA